MMAETQRLTWATNGWSSGQRARLGEGPFTPTHYVDFTCVIGGQSHEGHDPVYCEFAVHNVDRLGTSGRRASRYAIIAGELVPENLLKPYPGS